MTGNPTRFEGLPAGTRAVQLPDNFFNSGSYFLTVFGRPDSASACECERTGEASLAQSLHLLNAREIHEMLQAPTGRAAKLASDKDRSDEDKIRELYHVALCREPDVSELAASKGYIEQTPARSSGKAEKAGVLKKAYEDLVWALINTKEFSFNH